MNLSVGIVGLPNVGKSTLFNALLKKQAAFVANYPFATIEPNIGIVPVPDTRLEQLSDIVANEMLKQVQHDKEKRPPIVPATVKFVDIAGLVKGANEGAGLGNKFLSHIREVSIIAHVVRAFEDPNVIKEGSVDPKSDYQTIQTELILADLETITNSKRKNQSAKPPASQRGEQLKTQSFLDKILESLNAGIPVREVKLLDEEKEEIKNFHFLTAKPEIVVLNVSEDDYSSSSIELIIQEYREILHFVQDDNMVVICAKIEAELSELSEEDQKQYLKDLGFAYSGLERLIQKAYETLGLISFLTAGEKEVRAWTLRAGETAISASGHIHTDFMAKFIKAEVVSFEDFVQNKGWKGAREAGKSRFEGRDYIMQDGDVVEFKIGT